MVKSAWIYAGGFSLPGSFIPYSTDSAVEKILRYRGLELDNSFTCIDFSVDLSIRRLRQRVHELLHLEFSLSMWRYVNVLETGVCFFFILVTGVQQSRFVLLVSQRCPPDSECKVLTE